MQPATLAAFPDLRIEMNGILSRGHQAEEHWTLTGTNTGPDGTGKLVSIRAYPHMRPLPGGSKTSA